MIIVSDQSWGGIPGIVVVAPRFSFYDAAHAAKIIEKEVGIYSTYKSDYVALWKHGEAFAKTCIPFVEFWI